MSTPEIPGLNIPLRTIYCIGKNYADHAKEMGNEVPSDPIVFLKPQSSIAVKPEQLTLPADRFDIHHEVEMIIAIGRSGKNIDPVNASEYIAGIGLGIDFTARDIQQKAKDMRHPWALSKGMDNFAPITDFIIPGSGADPDAMNITLKVNDEIRQSGNTRNMVFPVRTLISYLSAYMTLQEGDLIFTGTPSGVGSVHKGDQLRAELNDDLILDFKIT